MKNLYPGDGSNPNFSMQRRHLALRGAAAEAGIGLFGEFHADSAC